MRKILALILALALISAAAGGCTKEDNASSDTCSGRYTEKKISIEDTPAMAGELFSQNGKTVFIDSDSMKLYTEDENTHTFTSSSLPSTAGLGEDVSIQSIAGSSDGQYIFSYYSRDDTQESEPSGETGDSSSENNEDENDDDYFPECAYISADGKLKKLSPDVKYGLKSFAFSEDGKAFASDFGGNVYEINTDDQTARLLFSADRELAFFDIAAGHIIAADKKELYFYNIKDDKLEETPDVLARFYKDQKLGSEDAASMDPVCDFCGGTDNSVCIISKNGLYRYVMDGNQVEQILDGLSYHIGSPAYKVRSVIAQTENSFMVTYTDGTVMLYSYDPSASAEITSSIKIYSLKENDTLSQAISEYKINNPDVKVEYETGMSADGAVTYEDAVKNLNTEICSGNAPDVLMLDGMDAGSYISKNMLADLSEYKNKIDPDDSLLDNVAMHTTGDGVYTVTCKFGLPVIAASQKNIAKINSFSDFADMVEQQHKIITDTPVAGFCTEDEVINTALDMEAENVITDKGIDTEQLRSMLSDCLKIYKSERSALDNTIVNDYIMQKSNYQSPSVKWGSEVSGISMNIINNPEKLACGTADGFTNSINIITSLNDQNKDIRYRYGFTDDSSVYVPVCSLGICSSSNNKDQAAKFLETALSSSVQNVELNDGLPVNIDSLEHFYSKNKTDSGNGFAMDSMFDDSIVLLQAHWMDDSEVDEFKNAVERLDTPVQIDIMTRDEIVRTGTKCLDENITVDEAVDEINEKLSLKLQE